ncbi:MAG: LysR substrate-binding domain-containing protein [Pseudomonadota bacterium]
MSQTHAQLPLRSLQVFEAAARCGSFTAAGDELGITQSGVSRQVSDLEALLGLALFTRKGGKVSVTPAGHRLAVQLAETFERMWSAVADVKRSESVVVLSMLPSFATRWFAPRLSRFLSNHPDVDLRITASRHLVDFSREGVDAAIRYSPRPQANLNAVKLGTETIAPVCSPAYAHQHNLVTPKELYRATLLYGDIPEDWSTWLAASGHKRRPPQGPRLGDDGAILQAAIEHQGVALGRSRLVAGDIAAGRLVRPFEISLEASYAYWFVTPTDRMSLKSVDAVRQWLVHEFDTTSSHP